MKLRPVFGWAVQRPTGRAVRTAVTLVLALWPALASAQIVAPASRTLFNRGVMVRQVLRYDTFDQAGAGGDVTRWRSASAVVWGARPNLAVTAVVPAARVERRDGATGSGAHRVGTGDLALFARYDVFKRIVPGGFTRLAPELGLRLPTGGTFGDGSTDASAALVFSHVRDRNWLIADLQLTVSGDGDGGARQGDGWRFDVAYLRRFRLPGAGDRLALAVLELNGETSDPARRGGVDIAGTGGDILFLSPGLEIFVGRRTVLEAALPIAIHADLVGAQPEPEVSFILGARWLF